MAAYLFLFRGGKDGWQNEPSPEKWQEHMGKWSQWMGTLAEQGKLLGSEALHATGKVVTGTGKVVTDGPFAEGKEMVGGYLLCNADSMDEAVTLSKGCPIFENDGVVEVREVLDMSNR